MLNLAIMQNKPGLGSKMAAERGQQDGNDARGGRIPSLWLRPWGPTLLPRLRRHVAAQASVFLLIVKYPWLIL